MTGHHPYSELRNNLFDIGTSSNSQPSQVKKAIKLQGQWIAELRGTNLGAAIVDIDRLNEDYICSISIFDHDVGLPNFHADFSIPVSQAANGEFVYRVISPTIYYPDGRTIIDHNAFADTNWVIDGDKITMTWKTNVNTFGSAICVRSDANRASELIPEVLAWEDAKSRFFASETDRHVFRGQCNSKWKLQTGFHRRHRYNLSRFESFDIPLLHAETSAKTKHVFDLSKPLENGAFYALLQHHGYPTPLLDWTNSPFVAAYFAFKEDVSSDNVAHVRIFAFDAKSWRSDFNQMQSLKATNRHFSLLKPLALENPRMAPQQSVFTVTNIADIEDYLLAQSAANSKKYLVAFDIPTTQRVQALHDLSLMGISAASLFPGIDGICEYHASRNFPQIE
jgi:FRG domain